MREWIVILEATCTTSAIDIDAVRRLVQALTGFQPGALYSTDRYALQLHVDACSPTQALATALHRWRDEVSYIGDELVACDLARAEVLTPEEYELEHEANGDRSRPPVVLRADRPPDDGEELLRRALFDSITGLPSRQLFVDQVDRALIARRRSGSQLAVLCIELGGSPTGSGRSERRARDEVRQRLAARLAGGVRPADTAARLGEDHFAVMLEHTSPERATAVATRLLEVIGDAMPSHDGVVVVSARVGIAMSEAEESAEELLRRAASAATGARKPGDQRVAWFEGRDRPAGAGFEKISSVVGAEDAAILGILTVVARAANDAATLEQAASVAIKQVCAHTGWPAGRLHQPDGDGLHSTRIGWATSPRWSQHLSDVSGLRSSPSGTGVGGRVTTVALAAQTARGYMPSPGAEPLACLTVPVLVGSEVVAVLEFLVDGTVQPDDRLVESLASVGIQLGRVVERNRTEAALRRLQAAEASRLGPA